jgi:CRP-like cAMP-binding protein
MSRQRHAKLSDPAFRAEVATEPDMVLTQRYRVSMDTLRAWRRIMGITLPHASLRGSLHQTRSARVLAAVRDAGAAGATEVDLARMLGCSRENVRQALQLLAAQQLVTGARHKQSVTTPWGRRWCRLWFAMEREGA